jgi:hypothetical protein
MARWLSNPRHCQIRGENVELPPIVAVAAGCSASFVCSLALFTPESGPQTYAWLPMMTLCHGPDCQIWGGNVSLPPIVAVASFFPYLGKEESWTGIPSPGLQPSQARWMSSLCRQYCGHPQSCCRSRGRGPAPGAGTGIGADAGDGTGTGTGARTWCFKVGRLGRGAILGWHQC